VLSNRYSANNDKSQAALCCLALAVFETRKGIFVVENLHRYEDQAADDGGEHEEHAGDAADREVKVRWFAVFHGEEVLDLP